MWHLTLTKATASVTGPMLQTETTHSLLSDMTTRLISLQNKFYEDGDLSEANGWVNIPF
jgi:hypothetical protein